MSLTTFESVSKSNNIISTASAIFNPNNVGNNPNLL